MTKDEICGLLRQIHDVLAMQPETNQVKPVAWMSNKDFEPIRIRIMQEAYNLADRNDSEGYNAIKVMCGEVQKMLPPQRTWVGLTQSDMPSGENPMFDHEYFIAGMVYADKVLKEKNT
jgi:hypothetical protein